MDKHEIRDMYIADTGNPFPDNVAKYADWLEEKFIYTNTRIAEIVDEMEHQYHGPSLYTHPSAVQFRSWCQRLHKCV